MGLGAITCGREFSRVDAGPLALTSGRLANSAGLLMSGAHEGRRFVEPAFDLLLGFTVQAHDLDRDALLQQPCSPIGLLKTASGTFAGDGITILREGVDVGGPGGRLAHELFGAVTSLVEFGRGRRSGSIDLVALGGQFGSHARADPARHRDHPASAVAHDTRRFAPSTSIQRPRRPPRLSHYLLGFTSRFGQFTGCGRRGLLQDPVGLDQAGSHGLGSAALRLDEFLARESRVAFGLARDVLARLRGSVLRIGADPGRLGRGLGRHTLRVVVRLLPGANGRRFGCRDHPIGLPSRITQRDARLVPGLLDDPGTLGAGLRDRLVGLGRGLLPPLTALLDQSLALLLGTLHEQVGLVGGVGDDRLGIAGRRCQDVGRPTPVRGGLLAVLLGLHVEALGGSGRAAALLEDILGSSLDHHGPPTTVDGPRGQGKVLVDRHDRTTMSSVRVRRTDSRRICDG